MAPRRWRHTRLWPMCIMVPMGRVQMICDFRNYNYWTGNAIGFRASCELCSNFLFKEKLVVTKIRIILPCYCGIFEDVIVPLQSPESSLQIVQRALVLLTNHLESFRKRYAYHLRQWQLDRRSIVSHHRSLQDKHSVPIHIVIQPASAADKVLWMW